MTSFWGVDGNHLNIIYWEKQRTASQEGASGFLRALWKYNGRSIKVYSHAIKFQFDETRYILFTVNTIDLGWCFYDSKLMLWGQQWIKHWALHGDPFCLAFSTFITMSGHMGEL